MSINSALFCYRIHTFSCYKIHTSFILDLMQSLHYRSFAQCFGKHFLSILSALMPLVKRYLIHAYTSSNAAEPKNQAQMQRRPSISSQRLSLNTFVITHQQHKRKSIKSNQLLPSVQMKGLVIKPAILSRQSETLPLRLRTHDATICFPLTASRSMVRRKYHEILTLLRMSFLPRTEKKHGA